MKPSMGSFGFIWKGSFTLAVCLSAVCRPSLGDPAHILSIKPQPARSPGDVVIFRAELADPTAPAGLFVWESDRDGILGVTSDLVLSRDAAGLSQGGHTITLSSEDIAGARVHCGTAPLFVVAPPIVRLTPLPGAAGDVGFDVGEEHVSLELHRIEVGSDFLDGIRLHGIIYRPLDGTTFRGVERPHLAIDRNADGRVQKDEIGPPGLNDGDALNFSGLDLEIRAGERLLLTARVARRILRGDSSPPGLLILAILALSLLAVGRPDIWRRGCSSRPFVARDSLALLLFMTLETGCKSDGERSRNLQFTLRDARDFDATAADSGLRVEIEDLPPEGVPGPRYRIKG